nr:tetratricopeptide repeat protein [uncultured Desulfuromonas sp.]
MKILRLLTSIVLLTVAIGTLNGCTRPGEDEFNKGIEAQRDNQLEQAKELFHTALSKDPSLAEAHINLGYVYLREKNYDKAWEETTVGLEKIKESHKTIVMGQTWQDQAALAYNNLAKIVFEKAIQAKKAGLITEQKRHQEHTVSLLNQALELVPDLEMTQKNLAYVQRWIKEQ